MVAIARSLPWILGLTCMVAVARDPAPDLRASGLGAPITVRADHLDLSDWDVRLDSLGSVLPWRLMGDYYFAPASAPAWSSGLRVSGGLLGLSGPAGTIRLGPDAPRTRPYVGLYYSTTGGAGSGTTGRWGLSADIGGSPGTPGGPRVRPMLQVGVSYAF